VADTARAALLPVGTDYSEEEERGKGRRRRRKKEKSKKNVLIHII
jgi:hypothetical protein